MKVSMIAAKARNGVIGKNNDLPWHLPDDFNFFKEKTNGHYVIMGRKNFESLPHKFRPLPNRTNIIITRNESFEVQGALVVHSIEEALKIAKANSQEETFIIGGSEIYRLGFKYADALYLTEINGDVEGDVHFPDYDRSQWKEIERVSHGADSKHKHSFDFVTYERIDLRLKSTI